MPVTLESSVFRVRNHASFPQLEWQPALRNYLYGGWDDRLKITLRNFTNTNLDWHEFLPFFVAVNIPSDEDGLDIVWTGGDGASILPYHMVHYDNNQQKWYGIIQPPPANYNSEDIDENFIPTANRIVGTMREVYAYYNGPPRPEAQMSYEDMISRFDYMIPAQEEPIFGNYFADVTHRKAHVKVDGDLPTFLENEGPNPFFPHAWSINAGDGDTDSPAINTRFIAPPPPPIGSTGFGNLNRIHGRTVIAWAMVRVDRANIRAGVPYAGRNYVLIHDCRDYSRGSTYQGYALFVEKANNNNRLRVELRAEQPTAFSDEQSGGGYDNLFDGNWHIVALVKGSGTERIQVFVITDTNNINGSWGNRAANFDPELVEIPAVWFGGVDSVDEPALRATMDVAAFGLICPDQFHISRQLVQILTGMLDPENHHIENVEQESVPENPLVPVMFAAHDFTGFGNYNYTWDTDNSAYFFNPEDGSGNENPFIMGSYPGCPDTGIIYPSCWQSLGNDDSSDFFPNSPFLEDYQDENYYSVNRQSGPFACVMLWRCVGNSFANDAPCNDPTELRFIQHLANGYRNAQGFHDTFDLGGSDGEFIVYCDEPRTDGFIDPALIPTVYNP